MTRVPVRFTYTVSTELKNYAMIERRNVHVALVVYSWFSLLVIYSLEWSSLLVVYSWSTRGLLVVSTTTSITILSPCASRHRTDLRYYRYHH
eukprot:scaffold45767_cov32-Attheya_sp.AAC.3